MSKAEEKMHTSDAKEMKEDARIQEMEEMKGKMRDLEMGMDSLERRAKRDSRRLRITAALWLAVGIANMYTLSRAQANNRTLIKMEQEYTAVHKEHDALIEKVISRHEKLDQQLEELIRSLGETHGLQDEEEKRWIRLKQR